MPPPASRVMDVCTDLLGAVIDGHGGSLPSRTYVSAGAPAWDCELLSTWCERTYTIDGDVGTEARVPFGAGAGHTMRAGLFVVTLLRCTPAVIDTDGLEPVLPTVEQEQEAAELLYEDNQRIMNALVAGERNGALPGCHGLVFTDWRSLGPFGGLVAGEQRLAVGLSSGV